MLKWEKQAKRVADFANAILDKYKDDIANHANNNAESPFKIPKKDIDALKAEIDEANEVIRQSAIDTSKGDKSTGTKKDKKKFDKITKFFILKNLTDGVNRIHGAAVARQIMDDDRDEAVDAAFDRSKAFISSVADAEAGSSYTLFHQSIAVESGFRYFVYYTSLDDVVRDKHNKRHGKAFKYGAERVVDDVPGLANHCRCFAIEITDEEAKDYTFFYPEDAPVSATSGERGSQSIPSDPMNKKFTIFTKDGEVTIDVVGYIDDWDGNDFRSFQEKIESYIENDDDKVVLNITSRGGYADDSLKAYDLLKSIPNHVTANVYGYAGSGATQFTSAADHATIGENDSFLIHNARGCPCGTKEDLADYIDQLSEVDQQQIENYKEKTGKSEQEIIDLMIRDEPITAQEALDFGLVDEIRPDSKRSKAARGEPVAKANFKALAQARNSTKGDDMKTREQLEQELTQANDEIKVLTKDLKTEKAKTEVAVDAATSNDISDEVRESIYTQARKDLEAESKAFAEAKQEVEDAGFEAQGDTVSDIYTASIKSTGKELSGDYDEGQLKEIFSIVAATNKRKKIDHENSEDIVALGGDVDSDDFQPGSRSERINSRGN